MVGGVHLKNVPGVVAEVKKSRHCRVLLLEVTFTSESAFVVRSHTNVAPTATGPYCAGWLGWLGTRTLKVTGSISTNTKLSAFAAAGIKNRTNRIASERYLIELLLGACLLSR